jgi:EpsI family protein
MSSMAIRLYVVVALIVGAYVVSHWLQITIGPPEAEMPDWSIRDLPYQLGDWLGADAEMDPKIAVATGAEVIVNRAYRSDSGQTVFLHAAMLKDPVGVYHCPTNCYPSSGWHKVDDYYQNVRVSEELAVAAKVTTWGKGQEYHLVAYWYQLGNHVLYNRFDLGGKIRWEMRGQPKWPVLLKVMTWIPLTGREGERTNHFKFTEEIAKWLNQPEHQQYLARWDNL